MKYNIHQNKFLSLTKIFFSLVIILTMIPSFWHSSTSAQASTNLYVIGDMIWNDANVNGVQDAGEDGIPYVVMELLDEYGDVIATTTTGSEPFSGQYSFEVLPGKYTVRVAPENFAPGGALEGFTPTADYNGDGVGENECTQWVIKLDILTFDFGYWQAQADLAVTKTNGVTVVGPNSSITYMVRVTNNGPDSVTGATFIDTASVGLTVTAVVCSSAPGNQCVSPPSLAELISTGVTLPTLASGAFYEIELTALVTAASGSVTNTATITPSTGTTDPTPGNNTATDTDTVTSDPIPSTDLSITKTNGVTILNVNSSTSYIIRVINNGPDSTTGATLLDTAGLGLTATAVGCSPAPDNQCVSPPLLAELISTGVTLPILASGQFYEIELTATVIAASGSVTNTVTITPSTGTTDPTPGNNTATDIDTVTSDPIPSTDLSITKTNGVTTLNVNSSTSYTIRVINNGPDSTTGATLMDTAGLGLIATGVVCSSAPGNQCISPPMLAELISAGITLPILTSGQIYEIELTATVIAASGSVTNTVTVIPSTSTTDPTSGNNTATDIDTVTSATEQSADLSITKTNGGTTVNVNGLTSYTIRVTNNGPDSTTGATLMDIPGVSLTATGVICSSAPGNQCVSPPLVAELISTGITLPILASGQFYEIELTATVIAVTGLVPNIADVIPSTSTTDPDSSNNTATDTDTLTLYHLYLPMVNSEGTETPTVKWNTVIGYEDLPMMTGLHDFDYNDWAVAIDGTLDFTSVSSNLLQNFAMAFTPYTRGAFYDHTFQILIPAQTFAGNGTAVINLYDQNRNLISRQVQPFFGSSDNIYVIFSRTSEVFPGSNVNTVEGTPLQPAQRFADLTIAFDTPGFFIFSPNSLSQSHGQGLFFDPTLVELNKGEEIHRGDVRMLSLPIASWLWPEEGVRIDRAYPLVVHTPGTPSDFNFPSSWWIVYNHCIYDGLPCNAP
jgi:uncharacterized repeat protein (TIGR01451 family)